MFDGMAKLEKLVNDNKILRDKSLINKVSLNSDYQMIVKMLEKEKPMQEWSFWEVNEFLSTKSQNENQNLLFKFLNCALNVQLLDDDTVVKCYLPLFLNIDKAQKS